MRAAPARSNTDISRLVVPLLSAGGLAISLAPRATAQWTLSSLHAEAPDTHSYASGTHGANQVGRALSNGGTTGNQPIGFARMWSGTALSRVDLHPPEPEALGSAAWGAFGDQQVGIVTFPFRVGEISKAALWTGSAASWVNLNPANARTSTAEAVFGSQQVGGASFTIPISQHAGLWTGTATSWLDLHPPAAAHSLARATNGAQQGGWALISDVYHASLWSGTPESWVDLHPAGAQDSWITGVTNTLQAGSAKFGGQWHAGVWNATAASWTDLHPAVAATSQIHGAFGPYQVGEATVAGVTHASLWTGAAASWVDLSTFAPGYTNTVATGVWTDGDITRISGYGTILNTGLAEALLWTVPAPGGAAMLGLLGLAAVHRRRVTPA